MDSIKYSGFVLIIGETNAGKSTFINNVIGAKVSIVSHKVQTTRFKTLGVYTEDNKQVIFIDTPGIFKPKRVFDKAMIKLSYSQIQDADIIMLMIDAQKGITDYTKEIISSLTPNKKNIFVVNKIDLVTKEKIADILNEIGKTELFDKYFLISAKKLKGCKDITEYLKNNIPKGAWYFDEDQISDIALDTMATEITREKIYKFVNQELPYNMVVEHVSWEEDDKKIIIHQNIYVSKSNYKSMILGKGGEKIKSIRIASQKEIEDTFQKRVNLYLYVKVDEKIFDRKNTYQSIGLEF